MSYSNFNKLYISEPHNYFQPSSLEELIDDIRRGVKPVRIVGSIHTFNDISMTSNDGTIINTSKLNIINVNENNKTVTVECGTKLRDLLDVLEQYNLTLPVVTATNNISIVGGISTGSHGSNILNGSMSSLVLSAELITENGSYKYIENNDINAIRCSLGCLGAIYSVTLKCVDLFSIIGTVLRDHWQNIAQELEMILQKYPYTDINIDQFSNNLYSVVNLRKKVPYDPKLGPGYNTALTGNVTSWYIEIELAFPLQIINTAIKAVCRFHQKYKDIHNIYTSSPLLIRFSSSDNTLISMASGRETVYISTFFGNEYEPKIVNEFMSTLSDEMVNNYGARPHYGKQHNLSKDQMYKLYGDRYNDFLKIKGKYDPDNKFSNEYIRRII